MISVCRQRLGSGASADFLVGQVQSIPFEDERFDATLCLGVLEYVSELERNQAVQEIWRVLKPGGLLIASHLNANSAYWRWDDHIVKRSASSAVKFVKNVPRSFMDRRAWHVEREQSQERKFEEADILKLYNSKFRIEKLEPYGVNIVLQPFDRKFPRLALAANKKIESLRNFPRWAAWAYLLCARKI